MIRKELAPFASEDKFARSGRAAEEQMAFYLKRFFERKPDIHVLNSIRLEANDDAAQIDHLILHPYGFVIVESKSVQGKVQIKDDGQWIRWYGDNSKGMASPITQARLQIEFLKTTLGRAAGSETFFDPVPFDLMVAISDSGVIIWPKSGAIPEVCKADQVADKVLSIVNKLGNSRNQDALLSNSNIEKIIQYLLTAHRPLKAHSIQTEVVAPPTTVPEPIPEPISEPIPEPVINELACKHCGSKNLQIRFGHTYFYYCNDCQKNTSIKSPVCPTCGENERVRKKGQDYFWDCKKCDRSEHFFHNQD